MKVYLDYHATTPVDPRVFESMRPYFTEVFGNPASSTHAWGWKAQEAVETARREAATLIGASAREIVFTSGATESNNLAIRGVAALAPADRRHVVASAVEHKSVLESIDRLREDGWRATIVRVHPDGVIDLDALATAVGPDTAIVSVIAANNEIGVIQPLEAIGRIAHGAGALFHTDAAQAAAKIAVDVDACHVDLLSFTGHKMYGPKGCGALYVRKKTPVAPLQLGGGQERGLRSGTLNVPGIVGFGKACAIGRAEMASEGERLGRLRDRLLAGLNAQAGGVTVNGSMTSRLPHNLHVTFDDVDGESLLLGLGDLAVSTGSACASASATPSHVLQAIRCEGGVPAATIRFGLGRFTTEDEITYAIEKVSTVVRHLRATAPATR